MDDEDELHESHHFPGWLSQREAAAYLQVSVNTLRHHAESVARYVGRLPRYSRADLDALLKQSQPPPKTRKMRRRAPARFERTTNRKASRIADELLARK